MIGEFVNGNGETKMEQRTGCDPNAPSLGQKFQRQQSDICRHLPSQNLNAWSRLPCPILLLECRHNYNIKFRIRRLEVSKHWRSAEG